MKKLIMVITLILFFSVPIQAQQPEYGPDHHVTLGYTTQTGNFGPNGFEGGIEYRLRDFVAAVGEGSFLFSKDRINDVRTNLSPSGSTNMRISTDAQNFLFGPRFFFPRAIRQPKLVPFAHLLFGVSRESTDIELALEDEELGTSTDTNWAWTLGGGVDYWFNQKWAVRGKIDILRTHFRDDAQSKARFTVSLCYNFNFKK
jgi:Outer membrane protein beta-barrel domain